MATKKLDQLKPGESLLTKIRKVEGGKMQIEIASFCEKGINVAAMLNKGDDRFRQAKPRRAWMSATPTAIMEIFGIDTTKLTFVTDAVTSKIEAEVNLLNPSVPTADGKAQLNVRILEYTESELLAEKERKEAANQKTNTIDFYLDNVEKMAKKTSDAPGADFVKANDEHIFSIPGIVAGKPVHKWVIVSEYEAKAAAKAAESVAQVDLSVTD